MTPFRYRSPAGPVVLSPAGSVVLTVVLTRVRLRVRLQISPLLSISLDAEVTAAGLSPSRPLVVFVTTGRGEQHVFDMTRRGAPLHTIRLQEKPLVVTALRLNHKQ